MRRFKKFVPKQWKPFTGGILLGIAVVSATLLAARTDAQTQDGVMQQQINPILHYSFRPLQPPFPPGGFPQAPMNPYTINVAPNGPGSTPRILSDRDIRISIQNQFAADSLLHRSGISVSVQNGVVSLRGAVDSFLDYERAEADAFAAGAQSVNNQLRVRSAAVH